MRTCLIVAMLVTCLAGCGQGDDDDVAIDAAAHSDSTVLPAMCATKVYDENQTCTASQWEYNDTVCPAGGQLDDAGMRICQASGDSTCYDKCNADSDCTDPCRPVCRSMALFARRDSPTCGVPLQSPKVCVDPNRMQSCPSP